MRTGILNGANNQIIKRYHFTIKEDKYKSTRHYISTQPLNNDHFLTDLINISKNRGFNKSKATYLAKTRKFNKWDSKILTGLFNTSRKNIFFGDINNKKHFIVFVFPNKDKEIIIYVFPNFYPINENCRNRKIKEIINSNLVLEQ